MSDMSSVTAWSVLLGIITPFLVAIVNNPRWSANTKRYVSMGIAVLVGMMNLIVNNALTNWSDFSLNGVLVNLVLVIGAAQTAYALLWKPTGAADKVEAATSPTDARSK